VSVDRPWALALLAVPLLLLWLRLRDARPRESEASSLLVWRRVAPADAAAARPRPPLAAWLEAAGAALLVLGLADPGTAGPAASSARVLLDASASMLPHADGVRGSAGADAAIEETAGLEGRLPGALASGEPLVVVTDRRLPSYPDDPQRLQVVGVGRRGFNAGITAASGVPLESGGWRLFLTVEASGAGGLVEGRLSIGDSKERITLTPGTPLEIDRETPGPVAEAAIDFDRDALDADDRVGLREAGGAIVHLACAVGLEESPLVRALIAAGARRGGDRTVLKGIGLWGTEQRGKPVLVHPPDSAEGPVVEGAGVATGSHPLVRDVRIDPSSSLGRRAAPSFRSPPGEVLLSDEEGALAWLPLSGIGVQVVLLFTPGGTWVERDPSFVVFAKNLVEYAAGGPARIEATGVLDPEETRQAAEGESFGDLRAALEAARRPDPAARKSIAPHLFAAAAAALAAAWWLAR